MSFYYLDKLVRVHEPADRCTPSHPQPHSLPHRATECGMQQLIIKFWAMIWTSKIRFFYELRSIGSQFVCLNLLIINDCMH